MADDLQCISWNCFGDLQANSTGCFTFSSDSQIVHPSLCQLLFESQSPQLVPNIFSGKRFSPNCTSQLDYFATGYCIAHSDATASWSVWFTDSPQCFQAFSHGLHYSPTTTCKSTIEMVLTTENSLSPYLEIFPSLHPFTQRITVLSLMYGGLCSSNESVSVASVLSHYCPRLRELTLPKLHPLSPVPQLPQHTLEQLTLFVPFLKDESVLGLNLQQCLALKNLCLAPVNKLVIIQFTHTSALHACIADLLYSTHGTHSNRHELCCLTCIDTSETSRGIRLQIAKTVPTYTLQIVSHFCKHGLTLIPLGNEPVLLKMADEL